jgi:glycosyltransferase involved in cell wall biosynthesis
MRIGLSCNAIEPTFSQGKLDGIGNYTQELYQQLKASNDQVVPAIFPHLKNLKPTCELPNAFCFKAPYALAAAAATCFNLDMASTHHLAKKIDIFHSTDYHIPFLKNIPVVATIHDAVKIQHPAWNNSKWRRLKNRGLKKAVRWADHYITSAYAMIPELEKYFGITSKNITVIYPAIAEDWHQKIDPAAKQQVLAKYQLEKEFLLFASTFQPRKNISRILGAYQNLPVEIQQNYLLVLVGQRGWVDETVIEKIRSLTQQGKIKWLDYISSYELRCLFQSAKMLLCPSLHEGFGLPILEAFASETPVITSNITAMPEIAGGAAWLVDPYCEEAIRDGILTLINSPAKSQELVLKGKERLKTFTWTQFRDNVLEVYKKLL